MVRCRAARVRRLLPGTQARWIDGIRSSCCCQCQSFREREPASERVGIRDRVRFRDTAQGTRPGCHGNSHHRGA